MTVSFFPGGTLFFLAFLFLHGRGSVEEGGTTFGKGFMSWTWTKGSFLFFSSSSRERGKAKVVSL